MGDCTAEQHVAALLRGLPAAPAAWVTAACEIPRTARDVERPADLHASAERPDVAAPAPEPKIVP